MVGGPLKTAFLGLLKPALSGFRGSAAGRGVRNPRICARRIPNGASSLVHSKFLHPI